MAARGDPQGGGDRRPHHHGLDELELGAVQMGDHRYLGPTASDAVVLGGEVVEVEHVGVPSPGRRERCLPHPGQVIGQRRVDRGQHHIGRFVAFFEGRVYRHWCRHRTATRVERRHRCRGVQILQLDIPNERRRVVSSPGEPSDPVTSGTDQPASPSATAR